MWQQSVCEDRPTTVLVADDDDAVRAFLSALLEAEGYHILQARDGNEAVRVLRGQPVDTALIDVMMPGQNGFAVCKAVKADPKTRLLPLVLVTGLEAREDRIKGIECGADDFLTKPVNKQELLARVRSLVRLKQYTDELENAEAVICSLALSVEAKDPYTEGHCQRLSEYSVALGKRLGMPDEQQIALRRAGVVHDIGKVAVPEHILLKKGPLTAEERAIVRTHPVSGERICAPLKSFRLVLPIIRHHHEKLDGSGYPDGLKGEQIPLLARILQIADVYDALATDRPYRRALPHKEALALMWEEVRRGWWEGHLLGEFEHLALSPGRRNGKRAVPAPVPRPRLPARLEQGGAIA